MNLDQIRPLGNKLLVLLPANVDEQQTEAGLFKAYAMTPPPSYGRVLKVGPAVREVREGDIVAFPTTAGDEFPLTKTHAGLFLREPDIAAIVRKHDLAGPPEVV